MDRLTTPPEMPLDMPSQKLGRVFRDCDVPAAHADRAAFVIRLVVVAISLAVTAGFGREMVDILAKGGLTGLEIVMAVAFIASFVWIAFSAVTATAGASLIALGLVPRLARAGGQDGAPGAGGPLSVALLVPTCNEAPDQVFANALAMLRDLEAHDPPARPLGGEPGSARSATAHQFALFVLSDTTDPVLRIAEERAFAAARAACGARWRIYYRRRGSNEGRKAGNIAEWCRRWGGAYDAFLVLDADSLMSARAVIDLTDALAGDPSAALVQSVPRLVSAQTVFGRMQEFAASVYGPPLAAGQALWSRGESNYWGHNAIVRTRAFAAAAGLPDLPGRRPFGGTIMSHDFVEAALLRRAGWRVRMAPGLDGSYEEAPPTLIDTALRDRRWCQGNLQHLGVMGARGLHPVSRFHLLQGMMAYVSSLLWLLFLAAGTAVALRAGAMPVDYFPQDHVLFPAWPIIDSERAVVLMLATIAVLLVPKLAGLSLVVARRGAAERWGGWWPFVGSALIEVVLTAIMAPVFMIQHSLAVLRTLAGFDTGWKPQRRRAGAMRWRDMARFHAAETVIGAVLFVAMLYALVPLWLAPIAISLMAAVPLSALAALPVPASKRRLLAAPERLAPPRVLTLARTLQVSIDREPAAPHAAQADRALI